jgi:hypothetical protein
MPKKPFLAGVRCFERGGSPESGARRRRRTCNRRQRLVAGGSVRTTPSVVDALRRHKAEVVAMLRPGRDGWSAEDWQAFFDERAAIAEFDGRLQHTEAEAQALACCIVEWLNRNPTPSAPGRCAWCGQAESRDGGVLPYGTEPGTHIWLHAECWPAWQDTRRSQAREALARMGVGRIVIGGCGHACMSAAADTAETAAPRGMRPPSPTSAQMNSRRDQ